MKVEVNQSKHGMKAKTIKSIIHNKIEHWLESIEDVSLRNRVKDKVIVTGGAIASMLLGEEVNDDLIVDDALDGLGFHAMLALVDFDLHC